MTLFDSQANIHFGQGRSVEARFSVSKMSRWLRLGLKFTASIRGSDAPHMLLVFSVGPLNVVVGLTVWRTPAC